MKNMKLTNLSLSVLIALGLVACGGSDDKGNAATDTDTSGSTGGTGSTGPKIENNGKTVPVDPKRAAPSLEVEANVATSTKVAKQLYIDRRSRDAIAGYNGDAAKLNIEDAEKKPIFWTTWNNDRPNELSYAPSSNQGNMSYNPGATDAKDILRGSSIYNYYKFQSEQGSLNVNGGIHANPSFSYALGEDGNYYRVEPNGGVAWSEITSDTEFKIVNDATFGVAGQYGVKHGKGKKIPQSEIVFIPNALVADKAGAIKPEDGLKPQNLGSLTIKSDNYGVNVLNPKKIYYFDLNRGEVEYKSFDLAGVHYDLVKDFNTNNIVLDLSKVPVEKAIQNHAITLNYNINNTQSTATLTDDDIVSKTAKVGEMKLYNLPYSRSSILVNQQAVEDANDPGAAPNNIFGLSNAKENGHYGAFQVVGFQTTAIPRDGRADYVGKSYGVNSVGDIELRADFAINRAGIHGSVSNRQTLDGKRKLADLTLGRIALVDPNHEETASRGMQETSQANDGVVSIGGRGVGAWAVALYGPNAEEAAGVIDFTPSNFWGGPVVNGVSSNVAGDGKQFEVFSSQRGSIIKDSLNPGVGNP